LAKEVSSREILSAHSFVLLQGLFIFILLLGKQPPGLVVLLVEVETSSMAGVSAVGVARHAGPRKSAHTTRRAMQTRGTTATFLVEVLVRRRTVDLSSGLSSI